MDDCYADGHLRIAVIVPSDIPDHGAASGPLLWPLLAIGQGHLFQPAKTVCI
jgi:hypothetical protein